MRFYLLSSLFFTSYPEVIYPEFERKIGRPYTVMIVKYNGTEVAIPLRSNVNHRYKFSTVGNKGLDFTKTVFLINPNFIDLTSNPSIDNNEFAVLYGKENDVAHKFNLYVAEYIKAFQFMLSCSDYSLVRYDKSYKIVTYSTLHYYHSFLNILPYDPNSFPLPL